MNEQSLKQGQTLTKQYHIVKQYFLNWGNLLFWLSWNSERVIWKSSQENFVIKSLMFWGFWNIC